MPSPEGFCECIVHSWKCIWMSVWTFGTNLVAAVSKRCKQQESDRCRAFRSFHIWNHFGAVSTRLRGGKGALYSHCSVSHFILLRYLLQQLCSFEAFSIVFPYGVRNPEQHQGKSLPGSGSFFYVQPLDFLSVARQLSYSAEALLGNTVVSTCSLSEITYM